MKNHYFVEMTDTFGGEANYCWVNRFIVSASSERGAMRKVAKKTGFAVRSVGCDRWDAVGACVCYFVEWMMLQTSRFIRTTIPESRYCNV